MTSNKTIFITGGAGFIANTMIARLVEKNKIVVYDNYHRDTLSGSAYANHPNITIVKGDVLDLDALTKAMKGADIVIHAAGIAGIDTVIKDPVKTMRVNMIGTANALEAAHVNNITDRFIDFQLQRFLVLMLLNLLKEIIQYPVALARLVGLMQ
jgi:UDP-glucose 4-epimerase